MPSLIIAEKPNAAQKIADAIGKPKKHSSGKTYWFEVTVDGKKYHIAPSVGHIFSLKQKEKGSGYPQFDLEWRPAFEVSKDSAFTKDYFENIEEAGKGCDSFIIATDYDTEGSVIGANILKYIFNRDDAKRMKFSTLTKEDLKEAFENAGPLDNPQIEAGLARHELDWYFGVNLSRALTQAVNSSGKGFQLMSTGRVQGPALKILADRELKIKTFVPEPFWQVEANIDGIKAMYEYDKLPTKADAVAVRNKCGDIAIVALLKKTKRSHSPPFPFDLTTLQTEAYGAFGFSPTSTLSLAQSLYEAGLISYPRTSSQKLPERIGYKKILQSLSMSEAYSKLVEMLPNELKPIEGSKSDPAHPSIYPTGDAPRGLSDQQRKLYDMIARRFIALFSGPAVRQSVKVEFDIDGHKFLADGQTTLEKGWMEIYPFVNMKETELPPLKEGEKKKVKSIKTLEKQTSPPKRFTEASIVREMEKRSIGTKSTRAVIVRTLFDRNYIRGKPIEVTDLGLNIIKILEKYSPEILSEKMTRKFEKEMEDIMEGKAERGQILSEARGHLTKLLAKFKKQEDKVGGELSEALAVVREEERRVGPCPKCGKDLRIIISKASKKRFIGCQGYEGGCDQSFPLPQMGLAKTTDQKCKICSYPIVMIIRKGKRPWNLCINMDCPTKDEWKKKMEEKAKEKSSKKAIKKRKSKGDHGVGDKEMD